MPHPARFTVTTLNVWGSHHWPARSSSLVQTLLTLRSDVYLFQEVTPAIIKYFDENLGNYQRVKSESAEGWLKESNIYWNKDIFSLVDFGFADLEMPDYPLRGLFWARLALVDDPSKVVFVSTAHFPWVGCDSEIETGVNQRIVTAVKVCEQLRRLVAPNEAAVFGGDLNEDFHPVRILSEECAFIDVFESLDLVPPITHPVRPSDPLEELKPNRTLDWILVSLPSNCRTVGAFAKGVRGGTYPPISDHLPVVAIIEIN
eukprot:gene9595-6868_t